MRIERSSISSSTGRVRLAPDGLLGHTARVNLVQEAVAGLRIQIESALTRGNSLPAGVTLDAETVTVSLGLIFDEKPQTPAEKPEELSNEPQEHEDKPEEAQPPGDHIPQLAQLKLLKVMQEEYLERTEILDKFRDKEGKLPEAMEIEKNELAHG